MSVHLPHKDPQKARLARRPLAGPRGEHAGLWRGRAPRAVKTVGGFSLCSAFPLDKQGQARGPQQSSGKSLSDCHAHTHTHTHAGTHDLPGDALWHWGWPGDWLHLLFPGSFTTENGLPFCLFGTVIVFIMLVYTLVCLMFEGHPDYFIWNGQGL